MADDRIMVARSDHPAEEVIPLSEEADLLMLGLQRQGRRRKVFGDMVLKIAHRTTCSLILINRKG